ncbi:MAG TPA: hypothetical protein VJ782_01735, partial [Aeromicrobium sp.]|nr:hypothetical protein [Aeromicrobium sp.]
GLYVRSFEVHATPPGQIPIGAYVYGPVTSLFQHDVQRLLDTEPGYAAKTRPHHYAIRHAIIAGFALLGLLAAAGTAWLILGNWRWGVIAAGILSATPLWTGHAMFNMKDTPVAAGHTMITFALVLLALTKPTSKHLTVLAGTGTLAVGTIMMLGTRPGAWPSLMGSIIVFTAILVLARKSLTKAHVLRVAAATVAGLVGSYLVLWAIYPRVFGDLYQAIYMSAFGSAHYDGLGKQSPSDRSYLFVHALVDLPLGIVALMLSGTFVAAYLWLVQRRRSVHLDCIALVGSQAFALMAAAVALDSSLYHGLRQMLFAIPALAVLATIGLAALLTTSRGRLRLAVAIAGCVAMILPTAAQAAMFPYQYSYINVAAEQAGVDPNEDYFGMSFREYAYDGPQDVKVICPFMRMGYIVWRDDEPDCRTRFAHTFSAYWRGRPAPDEPDNGEWYTILRGSRPTPPNCEIYREVERWRNLEKTVMSRMFVCHSPSREEILEGITILNRAQQRYGVKLFWPDYLGERPKSGPGSLASLKEEN